MTRPMRIRSLSRAALAGCALLSALAACDAGGPDRVLAIEETSTVGGLIFLDRNGSGAADAGDTIIAGVSVQIRAYGTDQVVAHATTNDRGGYVIPELPVGTYRVSLDSAVLGDSLTSLPLATDTFTVGARDSVAIVHGVTYPTVTVAEARSLAAGGKRFVEGTALNAWTTFADATVHIAAGGLALRATGVEPVQVAPGDSVRILGTLGTEGGQVVLRDGRVTVLRKAVLPFPESLPAPDTVTTAAAAAADGGRLDAAQVRVVRGVVTDTTYLDGDFEVTVDDGSGPLVVLFDKHVNFARTAAFDPALLVPGALIDAAGVLVPRAGGSWQLKPRAAAEVGTRGFPSATIVGARAMAPGTRVQVAGLVLNSWTAFGDATVHLADSSAAIRGLRVQPVSILPGDSVRFFGTVRTVLGQPVLDDVAVVPLRRAILPFPQSLPTPETVTSGVAAGAAEGRLDAAQVKVMDAAITAVSAEPDGLALTVDDGSGRLTVLLDQSSDFRRAGTFDPAKLVVGARIDVAGVLVPFDAGAWQLKPRAASEITIR